MATDNIVEKVLSLLGFVAALLYSIKLGSGTDLLAGLAGGDQLLLFVAAMFVGATSLFGVYFQLKPYFEDLI